MTDEKIFISNLNDATWDQHGPERIAIGANPDLRFCYLVDANLHQSHGLSVGCLVIPVGSELPPHIHAPQEVYFIKSGSGLMLMANDQTRAVSAHDVVYIPPGEEHGLKNTGDEPLEIIWMFPTDSWKDIEYTYLDR